MEKFHLKTDNQQSFAGNKLRLQDYFFSLHKPLAMVYYILAYCHGRGSAAFEENS